jgi:hypothetical protein
MNNLFSKHEAEYINKKIEEKQEALYFNGKWLICKDEGFSYTEDPFPTVIKSTR